MNKKIIIFILLICSLCQLSTSQCIHNKYIVNSIDSVTLSYYYLINISPVDSINIKYMLLSNKINNTCINGSIIIVGGVYSFKLEPMYDIIERKGDKDSVYFSPVFMKAVVINNILLFNENFSIKPYKTKMLTGLRYSFPNE